MKGDNGKVSKWLRIDNVLVLLLDDIVYLTSSIIAFPYPWHIFYFWKRPLLDPQILQYLFASSPDFCLESMYLTLLPP
jgi:hypothetical protein